MEPQVMCKVHVQVKGHLGGGCRGNGAVSSGQRWCTGARGCHMDGILAITGRLMMNRVD